MNLVLVLTLSTYQVVLEWTTHQPNKQNDIAVIGEGVHAKFDEILVPNGLGHISIYTELGRFMTAPHGLVVTKSSY